MAAQMRQGDGVTWLGWFTGWLTAAARAAESRSPGLHLLGEPAQLVAERLDGARAFTCDDRHRRHFFPVTARSFEGGHCGLQTGQMMAECPP